MADRAGGSALITPRAAGVPAPARRAPVFTADSRWIRRAARTDPRMRLVCLPFAGGGASVYHRLPELLPPSIEVIAIQLPGREDRAREAPPGNIAALARTCAVALRPYLNMPFALYGHCAGALLAYEMAYEIAQRSAVWPSLLVAAAQPAPLLSVTRTPLHTLPDEALVETIRQRGGLPEAVLKRPELLDVLLPLLRSDFALWEQYLPVSRPPLQCPVHVLRGRDDDLVPADAAKGWEQHTTAGCTDQVVDGGHYFIGGLGQADAAALARSLLAPLGARTTE
jgi:medium-chain acyl-[acyl-carrier-protein] hydrolase